MARISSLVGLVRYRFFLFAGLFPYLLGQALAFDLQGPLNWLHFGLGAVGVFLVLGAVELLNEYFDAKEGGDRIFSLEEVRIPSCFFFLGILLLFFASLVGLYFAWVVGPLVLLFSLLGFLGAYFYVGPPLKWAYRGLGEIVIALSYGPFMVLGSYYLQTARIDLFPFLVSLVCALALFSLAVLNEIPDYYQDRLVGKKNIVVRLGRKRSVKVVTMGLTCLFVLLAAGIASGKIPLYGLLGFAPFPWVAKGLAAIHRDYDNPSVYRLAVNATIALYLLVMSSLIIGCIVA